MNNSIYVNMTPNPLDLQQLSCSQGDTSSRKFQFTLHNQGEVYDLSNISDPVFTSFPVEVGGTEELLPTNTSTPATSPIVADIRYPDGLRQEESFTYRESPTTVSGNAKLKALYGNTLVWNQLVQNGNFADGANNWTNGTSSTISASNGELTVTIGGTWNNDAMQNLSLVARHKYLGTFKVKSNTLTDIGVAFGQFGAVTNARFATANTLSPTYQTVSGIVTITESTNAIRCSMTGNASSYIGQTYTIKDVMIFDLTQMFGSGNEPTTDEQFKSMFALDYYEYDTGSLLSFNGSGIKTVEKNLLKVTVSSGRVLDTVDANGYITSKNNFPVAWQLVGSFYAIANKQFSISVTDGFANSYSRLALGISETVNPSMANPDTYPDTNIGIDVIQSVIPSRLSRTFTSNKSQMIYVWLCSDKNNTGSYPQFTFACQVEFGSTATSYEPYTSSITTLPTLTYFPTGMKSAGNVRDELTDNKKTVRVGTRAYQSGDENDSTLTTDGINTNYPLATPAVESIMSATLVTENGEAPLYHNGDVLECECNSDISSEAGFFDAKIGFTDSEGTNYSNKIQLHVERSPQ